MASGLGRQLYKQETGGGGPPSEESHYVRGAESGTVRVDSDTASPRTGLEDDRHSVWEETGQGQIRPPTHRREGPTVGASAPGSPELGSEPPPLPPGTFNQKQEGRDICLPKPDAGLDDSSAHSRHPLKAGQPGWNPD